MAQASFTCEKVASKEADSVVYATGNSPDGAVRIQTQAPPLICCVASSPLGAVSLLGRWA